MPSCVADLLCLASIVLAPSLATDSPRAEFPETKFQFGQALRGTVLEHDFVISNIGSRPLRIERVNITSPLLVTRMPSVLEPNERGVIHFVLDTRTLEGPFEGEILVFLNDPVLPEARLAFEGRVIPSIELAPLPIFSVAGPRGRGGRSTLELINHEEEPLQIESVEQHSDRLTVSFETVEKGQRYRLTLTLNADGPPGRYDTALLVRTSSKRMPVLRIPAITYLFDRVHTFPESVDLGEFRIEEAERNPQFLVQNAQTLMIYQEGGSDFRVKLSTDIPALDLKWEAGPKGDRYQATLTLAHDKLRSGVIKGLVFVETNDPDFPKLAVPVTGRIFER
jgi:hypothetical protein